MTSGRDATDTLGTDGGYVDPLWRVTVELTALEQDLLRTWWVRRLGFVAHAGAASVTTTQTYTRLEHSLGVLALVSRFAPDDEIARAAALLHDVGHLPFSHTFEGLAGLNHHMLGRARIDELAPVLERHGVHTSQVNAVLDGSVASPLFGAAGRLHLDHLDSFVRSGQAHGRTSTPPSELLGRFRLVDGAIDTDTTTADELIGLIVQEARSQRSAANIVACAVLRSLVASLLDRHDASTVAAMTDDECWAALLADPQVAPTAQAFRRTPQEWTVGDAEAEADPGRGIVHEITRSYLSLPTVDGHGLPEPSEVTELAAALPLRYVVHRRKATAVPRLMTLRSATGR